jgi:NRPS condensation-like uncharacterized protein
VEGDLAEVQTMANLTLAIEDDLLKRVRAYARTHDTTVNSMVRQLLRHTVEQNDFAARLAECLQIADRAEGHSRGRTWKRADLHDV